MSHIHWTNQIDDAYCVLKRSDPCAAAALDAYAEQAESLGLDDQLVRAVRDMADEAAALQGPPPARSCTDWNVDRVSR